MSKAEIRGLDKLLDQLDELADVQADKDFEMGMALGAAKAVERARSRVPVKTGKLRDSLHVGGYTRLTPGYRPSGFGTIKAPRGRGKALQMLVGSTAPHSHLVEMGTRNMPPRPYLRPAVDESHGEILSECDKAMQAIIDRR